MPTIEKICKKKKKLQMRVTHQTNFGRFKIHDFKANLHMIFDFQTLSDATEYSCELSCLVKLDKCDNWDHPLCDYTHTYIAINICKYVWNYIVGIF